jgi:DNA-binding response OmpR family regulator
MFKLLICEESLTFTAKNIFNNYYVDIAYSIDDVYNFTYENNYDIIIINYYFYDAIKDLKNSLSENIIMFVDEYYDISHIKKTFDIADNYLVKPLLTEELQIKVNYYYKRLTAKQCNVIKYKDFFYHINLKQLFKNNSKIKVTPNELKLIESFLTHLNQPLNIDFLYDRISSYSNGTLRVYISKIKKIGFSIVYDRSSLSYTLVND